MARPLPWRGCPGGKAGGPRLDSRPFCGAPACQPQGYHCAGSKTALVTLLASCLRIDDRAGIASGSAALARVPTAACAVPALCLCRAIVVLESNLGYLELHDLLLKAKDRRWGPDATGRRLGCCCSKQRIAGGGRGS